jgi:hypothetical protein
LDSSRRNGVDDEIRKCVHLCFGFDSPSRPFIARFKISQNIVRTS